MSDAEPTRLTAPLTTPLTTALALPRRPALLGAIAALAAGGAAAQTAAPPTLAALSARINANTVGIISGAVDGTYVRIAADLAAVLDDGDALRVIPMLGKGSVQNIGDILVLRGVDIGIVQSDVLAYAVRERLYPGLGSLIRYAAKLYDEEVHVVARAGIDRLEDLRGQTVNFDVRGSGTAMTASVMFEALGIAVVPAHDPPDVGLHRLRNGEIAAVVYVTGKPSRLFTGVPRDAGLRLLPVPLTDALVETYLPGTLTAADYPGLIPEGGAVETIAVGAVMAVYNWQPGTERHRRLAHFVTAFRERFPQLQQPPRHPKWREVNLDAQVPGWVRFDPAEAVPRRPRRRPATVPLPQGAPAPLG